jgi:O-antigen ligase
VRGEGRYLLLAGACGIWIVLSMTRIALLATVAAFFTVALFNSWRDRNFRLPLAAAGVILLVAIPLLPIALERTFGAGFGLADVLALVGDPVGLFHRMNFQGREVVWPAVAAAFLSSPVLGLGLGTSTHITLGVFDWRAAGVVHNEYLRLAADTGLVGLVLFGVAMLAWLSVAVRAAGRSGLVREFAIPAGAGMVAYAIVALTDNPFDYYAPFTQYIGLAVAGALALSAPGSELASEAPGREPEPEAAPTGGGMAV